MSWKKLGSKKLVSHPRIELYEDTVQLPNGEKTDYIHFGDPLDGVAIIAINDEGQVFIQKEYSYPPDQWLFQFPGGGIEEGESANQAAARELAEEGSLGGDLDHIGSFFIDNRRSSQKIHVFSATNLYERDAASDSVEEFEDFWLKPEQIEELIASGELCIYSALSAWAIFKANNN